MVNIIGTIIFGAVIGVLARFFKRGGENISVLWTVILGVVGVLVGNALLALFGYPSDTAGIDWIRWLVCIVCAIVAIGIFMAMTGRRGGRGRI